MLWKKIQLTGIFVITALSDVFSMDSSSSLNQPVKKMTWAGILRIWILQKWNILKLL